MVIKQVQTDRLSHLAVSIQLQATSANSVQNGSIVYHFNLDAFLMSTYLKVCVGGSPAMFTYFCIDEMCHSAEATHMLTQTGLPQQEMLHCALLHCLALCLLPAHACELAPALWYGYLIAQS